MAKNRKGYLQEYLESKEFDYDYKQDPLYLAMKKQYFSQAERTAEDVLGKYSQMSGGGTPSSSAIAAATQSANVEKSKLTEALPALYDLAWDIYDEELYNKKEKYEAVLDHDEFVDKSYDREHEGYYDGNSAPEAPDDNGENNTSNVENKVVNTTPFESGSAGKTMEKGAFEMTEKLIRKLVESGDRVGAEALLKNLERSMSQNQRSTILSIIKG